MKDMLQLCVAATNVFVISGPYKHSQKIESRAALDTTEQKDDMERKTTRLWGVDLVR